MKICLDGRVATKGGTSTFVDSFTRQLIAMTHRVEAAGHKVDVIAHPKQKIANHSSLKIPTNRMQELLWAQRALPRWLHENEYDIYHSLKHVGPISCQPRTIYRVPAVGQFDGSYPLSLSERFYWAHLAKRVYHRADYLIAVSDYIRDGLIKFLNVSPDRVLTIHNGVDGRFRRLPDSELDWTRLRSEGITRPFVLSVGNVLPVKNVESTIKAIQYLCRNRDFSHDLVIAGSTSSAHAETLQEYVESNGIANRVHFVGFQDTARMIELYSMADALLHMSLHEGFSLTILEAMACGIPIIAARTSSIPEAAGDAARYVEDPRDVGLIAETIDSVLASESTRSLLAVAAVERSRLFTWESCVEKTLAAYSQLEVSRCAG